MVAERPGREQIIIRTERRTKYVRKSVYGLGTLVVAGLIGLTHHSLGLSFSIGIPFTDAHLTFGGALGDPGSLAHALPGYTQGHINNLNDGVSYGQSMHIGPSGVMGYETWGKQVGAPNIDLNLSWGSPDGTFTIL